MIVADDDSDDCLLLQNALDDIDFPLQAIFMNDGSEVIDHLRTTNIPPKLVILDLNMPKITGMQVLEFINAKGLNYRIPVHVLSTSKTPTDKMKCTMLGAASYTVKPDNYHKLVDWLATLKQNLKQ